MANAQGFMDAIDERAKKLWSSIPTPLRIRIIPVGLVLSTGVVLGLSAWLTPAAEGHATHLQLGLNPCTILSATGYPCPMCGATTTFALWAHLRPIDAILNQPFASLLFWMTVGTFSLSLAEILQPRRRWERLLDLLAPYELPVAGVFLAFMTVSWVYKTLLMS